MEDYPLYKRNAFSITPLTTRITLDPGESYSGKIEVINPADAEIDLHYKISVAPYSNLNAEDEVNISDYSGIVDWVTLSQTEGTITPNGNTTISYTIDVPDDAMGGGQYFVFLVQNVSDTGSGSDSLQIKDVIELSSIVYATVNGKIEYAGEVSQINIPAFSLQDSVTTEVTITNNGNIHQDALIRIEVKDHFSGETISVHSGGGSNNENASESNNETLKESYVVMPGNSRFINVEVAGLADIGMYDLHETVYFNSEKYENNQTIITCPLWLIFIIILLLALMISGIVLKILHWRKKRFSYC